MNDLPAALKRLEKPYPFYSFLAAHSLLIGLLPFYLPVHLWGHRFSLADISLLIGATGFGFLFSLGRWQKAAKTLPLRNIFIRTFIFELLLVSALLIWPLLAALPVFSESNVAVLAGALVIGGLSGTYNAWFWTTQRSLFLEMTQSSNTGRQYGNFQLFVTLFLKVGILLGGLLLDSAEGLWVFISLNLAVSGAMIFWYRRALTESPLTTQTFQQTSLTSSLSFRDSNRSFQIFLLDGIFLFLESHFWLLSLFLVVREDYSALGITVVALALFFAISFWLIKNTIDEFTGNRIYLIATGLYAVSWILRAYIDQDTNRTALLISLMLITFCSSFFRLAFNKRFFDLARSNGGVQYLLIKSYLSQAILAMVYGAAAMCLYILSVDTSATFSAVYWVAAMLSLGYLLYRNQVSLGR